MKDQLTILYEDADLVAVDKPAGVPTIPARGDDPDSILARLRKQLNLPEVGEVDARLRVVHRIDRDTSGVLLMAKHLSAQRMLSDQFRHREVSKQYLAIVSGRPTEPSGHIDANLAAVGAAGRKMGVVRHGGRPAVTDWQVERVYRDVALLRVFPRTGKTHQIRVHLKHIGLPLAIDPVYHPVMAGKPVGVFLSTFKSKYRPPSDREERPLIDRLTLHAERLQFTRPDGQPMEIVAPLPKDFRATLNSLDKYSSRRMV